MINLKKTECTINWLPADSSKWLVCLEAAQGCSGFECQDGDLVFELAKAISVQKLL